METLTNGLYSAFKFLSFLDILERKLVPLAFSSLPHGIYRKSCIVNVLTVKIVLSIQNSLTGLALPLIIVFLIAITRSLLPFMLLK